MFEKDICLGCNHPKLMRMIVPTDPKDLDETLRVIISCDCPGAVFRGDWQSAEDITIMIGKTTCMEAVVMIGEMCKENRGDDQ